MSIRGWNQSEILTPRGAWTALQFTTKNSPERGFVSQNVRFTRKGGVTSREGTTAVSIGSFTTSAGKVTGMYNWISPTDNFLIYQDGANAKKLKLSDGTGSTITSLGGSARYPLIAELGPRIYVGGASSAGVGVSGIVVSDASGNVDNCFRGPLAANTWTAADGGAGGQCTQGTHLIAFLFTTRNGFTGQPGPVAAGALAPASVNVTGLHHIDITSSINTPADAGGSSLLIPIMTRADNLNNWFVVPSSQVSVAGVVGYPTPPASTSPWAVTIRIDITDEDLAGADSALPFFNYLVSGGVATAAPPTPDFIGAYGKRMFYGQGTTLYVSEINNPQAITADLNVVSNTAGKRYRYAFPLNQELFVGGDKWTGKVRDNTDSPSTWPPPTTVSEAIGPSFPGCVGGDPSLSWRWIATEFGIYLFTGTYADRPVTYLVQDQWKRVNWNAAYAIQIAEDVANLRVYVGVPLDAATEISHVFVIDYAQGMNWDEVDISLDNFGFGSFSSLRSVKEAATNKTTIWIGPQSAGSINRVDQTSRQDVGNTIIHAIWESGYVRKTGEIAKTPIIRLGNASYWVQGSGTLLTTWYGLDHAVSVSPSPNSPGSTPGQLTLATAPGIEYLLKGDLAHVENYSIKFEVNSLGDWFNLTGFRGYTKPDLGNR